MKSIITFVVLLLFTLSCESSTENKNHHFVNMHSENSEATGDSTRINTTFAVDTVEMAPDFLETQSIHTIIESKLGREILHIPIDHQNEMLVPVWGNGLIETVQECYDNHRPLELSPDVIWFAICQGVSQHINENFDTLENAIFKANKPAELHARNDDLAENPEEWANLISDLSKQTKSYTQSDVYSFFVPEFSTSTLAHQTVYEIALLEAFEKAFTYVGESGCGIPSITLTGTQEDWVKIYTQLDGLDQFNMGYWKVILQPVVQEFIAVFDGNINLEFWQNIFKSATEYNGFYVSGWIIKFFPYIKTTKNVDWEADYDVEHGGYRAEKGLKPNEYLEGKMYLRSRLSTADLPGGLSKIDLKWQNHFTGEAKDIVLTGGYFGMKQAEDKSLTPFITWVAYEKSAAKIERKRTYNPPIYEGHSNEIWSPNLARKVIDSAIYDIKNFDTQYESVQEVKRILHDSIAANPATQNLSTHGIEISMVILSDGSVAEIKLDRPHSKQGIPKELEDYIKSILNHMPEKWFPALAPVDAVLRLMPDMKIDRQLKVSANSKVIFTLLPRD